MHVYCPILFAFLAHQLGVITWRELKIPTWTTSIFQKLQKGLSIIPPGSMNYEHSLLISWRGTTSTLCHQLNDQRLCFSNDLDQACNDTCWLSGSLPPLHRLLSIACAWHRSEFSEYWNWGQGERLRCLGRQQPWIHPQGIHNLLIRFHGSLDHRDVPVPTAPWQWAAVDFFQVLASLKKE